MLLGCLLAVAITAAALAAYLPSRPGRPGATAASPPAVSPSHPAAAATGPPAAGPPAVLSPADPSRVASWNSGDGGAALSAVTGQAGTVLMAHGARQYVELRAYCGTLGAVVRHAQALPPIPDAAMARLYARALTLLAAGAADCQAAITVRRDGVEDIEAHENAPLLARALADLGTGVRDLYAATGKLRALPRHG